MKFRYPFDWQTPYGFIACTIFQATFGAIAIVACLSSYILTYGICHFVTTFTTDIAERLRELNEGLYLLRNGHFNEKQRIEKTDCLKEIIQFHSEAIKLSAVSHF